MADEAACFLVGGDGVPGAREKVAPLGCEKSVKASSSEAFRLVGPVLLNLDLLEDDLTEADDWLGGGDEFG